MRPSYLNFIALGAGSVLLAAGAGHAAIATGNLVAHYHAAAGVFNNNPAGSGAAGIAANDGDRVWEWWDQATAIGGNQLLQNGNTSIQPVLKTNVINGHPAVRFTNTTESGLVYIGGGAGGGTPIGTLLDTNRITWTIVYQNLTPAESRTLLAGRYDGTGGDLAFWRTYYDSGTRISHSRTNTAGLPTLAGVSNDANVVGTDWIVLTAVWDGVAGTFTEYVNGIMTGQNTQAFNDNPLTFNRYRLGANEANATGSRFTGHVAELLIYNTALTDAQRISTELALGDKYNLPVVPEPSSLGLLVLCAGLLTRRRVRSESEI